MSRYIEIPIKLTFEIGETVEIIAIEPTKKESPEYVKLVGKKAKVIGRGDIGNADIKLDISVPGSNLPYLNIFALNVKKVKEEV